MFSDAVKGLPGPVALKLNTMCRSYNNRQSLSSVLESPTPEITTSEISYKRKSQSARFSDSENPEQQNLQTTRLGNNWNCNQQDSRMNVSKCDMQQNFWNVQSEDDGHVISSLSQLLLEWKRR
jgi:hypothetical protein